MNYYYSVYGLMISSSRAIDLLPAEHKHFTDLDVKWATRAEMTPDPVSRWQRVITRQLQKKERTAFYRSEAPDGNFLKVCFITEFGELAMILDPGKKDLWILHDEKMPEPHLNSLFVGSILGCVLRLRGFLCFHGSVINIGGQAVVLSGKKKSGKSTTAKAFAERGFKVLSDDIAVINLINDEIFVQPGYPKVRLRPQPLELFYPDSDYDFKSVYSHRDSRYSDLNDSFWNTPLPLGAIYILGETEETDGRPYITPVSAERIIHLHSNTFAGYVITPDLQKQEFELIGQIVRKIPVQTLHFGRNVNLVYQQCETILEDLQQLNRTNAL